MKDKLGWFLCCSLLFNSMIGLGQEKTLIVKYEDREIEGLKVFRQYCSPCHRLDKNLVGPPLKSVTQFRSKEWIQNFLRDEKEMRTHDSIAKKLATEFTFSPCHQFTLEPKDFEALYRYLNLCGNGCADSSKKLSSHYEDEHGEFDGILTDFYSNGRIHQTILFNHGKYWTSIAAFDTSGKPINAGTLKKGNGSLILYFENGKTEMIIDMKKGDEVAVKYFDTEGRIMSEDIFSDGQCILSRKYDEKGNLVKETSWPKH